jgi:PAS domain S-box-containing protein
MGLAVERRLASLSLDILGVVDVDAEAPAMRFAREQGWATFTDLGEALAQPGLELLIELTGIDEVLDEVHRRAPSGVRVMDHTMARVFWDLDELAESLRAELRLKTALEEEIQQDRRSLQEILDSLPDVVMVVDQDGRIQRVNRRFESMTGCTIERVAGHKCQDTVCQQPGGADGPGCLCPRLSVMDSGEPLTVIRQQSCLGAADGGGERHYQVTATPFRSRAGTVNIVVTSRDVSDQVRLKRELIETEKHAAVGKLAAGVAHEINNPLTGILSFAEDLLEDTPESDPRHEDLAVIVRETLRCRRIVRDLLDFSRESRLVRQSVTIDSIVQRAVGLVGRQASFRDVVLSVEVDRAVDLTVYADANQLQQVMLNLIINARDAMDGRGTIVISVGRRLESGRARVTVAVADEGTGIAEELLERVFEPFFTTKGGQGNGLGLPAVRSIVEQHGGTVRVESEPGQGATFEVALPAARNPDSVAPPSSSPSSGL